MARLQSTIDEKNLRNHWSELARVINGGISYGDATSSGNIDGVWQTTTTPSTIGEAFIVTHDLGRVPSGFHIMSKNGPCDVYRVDANTTTITLKATGSGVSVTLFIF